MVPAVRHKGVLEHKERETSQVKRQERSWTTEKEGETGDGMEVEAADTLGRFGS